MTSPLRWGIAGAGRISADLALALAASPSSHFTAIAAASGLASAERFAAQHGDAHTASYGSYAELAASPDVDAVYIGTRNETHVAVAQTFLNAGKSVLLEKPAAPRARDVRQLQELAKARGVLFQEAYWTRFLPATRKLRELLAQGRLGDVSLVHADIGFVCDDPAESRMFSVKHLGGGLMDVGGYPVQFATLAFGASGPVQVQAAGRLGPTGVDVAGAALCRFGEGGLASLSWSLLAEPHEEVLVVGSRGRARLQKPCHASERLVVELDQGARGGHSVEVHDFPHGPATGKENYPNSQGLVHEVDAVTAAIRAGQLECAEFTWQESLRNAEIMEEIRRQLGVRFPGDED